MLLLNLEGELAGFSVHGSDNSVLSVVLLRHPVTFTGGFPGVSSLG